MKLHVRAFGPRDTGASENALAIDQEFDLPIRDNPYIEITLDNGAVLQFRPNDERSMTLTELSLNGRVAIAPGAGHNQFFIITRL